MFITILAKTTNPSSIHPEPNQTPKLTRIQLQNKTHKRLLPSTTRASKLPSQHSLNSTDHLDSKKSKRERKPREANKAKPRHRFQSISPPASHLNARGRRRRRRIFLSSSSMCAQKKSTTRHGKIRKIKKKKEESRKGQGDKIGGERLPQRHEIPRCVKERRGTGLQRASSVCKPPRAR